ncbi:MAG: hypothetical protein DMG21_16820 [Acidobacteria bacterium]|nr:MAG: hypothetical protein DMG21_16820 [Acidobacteriota bacterium]
MGVAGRAGHSGHIGRCLAASAALGTERIIMGFGTRRLRRLDGMRQGGALDKRRILAAPAKPAIRRGFHLAGLAAARHARPVRAVGDSVARRLQGSRGANLRRRLNPLRLGRRHRDFQCFPGRWEGMLPGRWRGRAPAAARGLLLAVPPVIVFALLLASADAVFAAFLRNIFRFNLLTLLSHVFLLGFFAWTSAGLLRGLLIGNELSWTAKIQPPQITLGAVELGMMLGAVNLTFLAFVIVQFRYFFGGAGLVQATTGLTFAEYARRGFFELVTASALVLPLLLGCHWLSAKNSSRHGRLFRILAGVLLALVFVVMLSALERMRLYQFEYGMTELRLYTTAFMAWLAAVLIWFALTVLSGRRQRFAGGALVAGYVLVVVLHLINPNALIANINTARARTGQRFDARYAASLGADAVPPLVAALPDLAAGDRCLIRERLLARWSGLPAQAGSESADWRSWNASRSEARRIVRENQPMLTNLPCPHQ